MRCSLRALRARGALLGALCCGLATALAAEDKPAPRDAAEVVQEGDVGRWLEHYQRERGAQWAKQQGQGQQAKPAEPGAGAAPAQPPAK